MAAVIKIKDENNQWVSVPIGSESTIDFTAGTGATFGNGRNYNMHTITGDTILHFVVDNHSDNYLLIKNNGDTIANVLVYSVTCNGVAINEDNIRIPLDDMTVRSHGYIELSIIVVDGNAIITCSSQLS